MNDHVPVRLVKHLQCSYLVLWNPNNPCELFLSLLLVTAPRVPAQLGIKPTIPTLPYRTLILVILPSKATICPT